MTEGELNELRHRIMRGEQPVQELWDLRETASNVVGAQRAKSLADLWNVALQGGAEFPKLEAAKAIVETALAANTTYPISTNDELVYDALAIVERRDLAQFISERLAKLDPSIKAHALREFADDLLGSGPQV